jgi:2'-5' RNA ligase
MTLQRTFIALELPSDLQNAIERETTQLRKGIGSACVRWVPVHNIHLTLKFLGDSSPASIELLKQMLSREALAHPPFEIYLRELGVFPNSRRPRVIWIGLSAPPTLGSLQNAVDAGAARLGYEPETRPFSPHLTIGRVRENLSTTELQSIRSGLDGSRIGSIGSARIESVQLYKSELQREGSVYTKLFTANLISSAVSEGGLS